MFKPEEMLEVVDGHALRFVRVVKHSPERVWRAITDEQEIRTWMRYPVKFEARERGHAEWFGDIEGTVLIFEPPRRLAFSFHAKGLKDAERGEIDWAVLWELEPHEGGCRITFTHRMLPGVHLLGLGEGWHRFLDQLLAHLDGAWERISIYATPENQRDHPEGFQQYRPHISRQLLAWAERAAHDARSATQDGRSDDALAAIGKLALAARQLEQLARQPRP